MNDRHNKDCLRSAALSEAHAKKCLKRGDTKKAAEFLEEAAWLRAKAKECKS